MGLIADKADCLQQPVNLTLTSSYVILCYIVMLGEGSTHNIRIRLRHDNDAVNEPQIKVVVMLLGNVDGTTSPRQEMEASK